MGCTTLFNKTDIYMFTALLSGLDFGNQCIHGSLVLVSRAGVDPFFVYAHKSFVER